MGSCRSSLGAVQPRSLGLQTLVNVLQFDCPERLSDTCSSFARPNNKVFSVESRSTSPLALALFLNAVKCFQYFMEKCHGSLTALSEELETVHKTSIFRVIMDNDCPELMLFCLPYYMKQPTGEQAIIHSACELGRFALVKQLCEYFVGQVPPREFNPHSVTGNLRENAALCSVKSGSLELVKLLHEEHRVNFHLKNARQESVLVVAAVASRRRAQQKFLGIVKYLVEVVKIDLTTDYEEALLILEDLAIVGYLERQLRLRGILVSKYELEMRNQVGSLLRTYSKPQNVLDDLEISSISINEEHSVLTFVDKVQT